MENSEIKKRLNSINWNFDFTIDYDEYKISFYRNIMIEGTSQRVDNIKVSRGEEKGYFEFGGSTIILLTQKGAVLPRKNILYRSARGEETRIRQGEKIGKVNNNQR